MGCCKSVSLVFGSRFGQTAKSQLPIFDRSKQWTHGKKGKERRTLIDNKVRKTEQ